MFNLGYYDILGESPEEQDKWRKDTLARIKAAYGRAKELGLLDHAYIYGCDENTADRFPGVQRAAEVFKEECPGALVMTTTYDHSFGTATIIKAMDAWCPLTPRFNTDLAGEVRAQGKQVWWYICCGPHHPFPNMFIEYPAVDGRVLMGAMTAKYRPDGFLYYQISIWNSERPIESGPFTTWDPRSWTTYHGDGSWTCVGPDGTPLPTIRLANFRDGLDDYAYVRILEATIAKVKADPGLSATRGEWLQQAEAALQVPEEIVKDLGTHTKDPGELYGWRDGIANLIEAAAAEAAYPW
jgi:hypothetical protein